MPIRIKKRRPRKYAVEVKPVDPTSADSLWEFRIVGVTGIRTPDTFGDWQGTYASAAAAAEAGRQLITNNNGS